MVPQLSYYNISRTLPSDVTTPVFCSVLTSTNWKTIVGTFELKYGRMVYLSGIISRINCELQILAYYTLISS